MEKAEIKISREVKDKMATMAGGAGLSTDKLVEVLLEAFLEGKGKVFVGKWKEGPGIRLLPDWPRFSSGVAKIKEEDLN